MADFYSMIDAYRDSEDFKARQQSNALANILKAAEAKKAQQEMADQQALRQAAQGAYNPQSNQFDFNRIGAAYAQQGNIEGAMKAQQMNQQMAAQKALSGLLSGQGAQGQQMQPQSVSGAMPGMAPQQSIQQQPISSYQKYRQAADQLMARGDAPSQAAAKQLYDQAEKIKPEVKETKTFTDPQTGKRVVVNILRDNSYEVLPFNPDLEKAHFADTGNAVMPLDPYTGRPIGGGIQKSMSPGEIATNQRALQAHEQGKWQYNPETGMTINAAQGVARPVIGPTGEPLNARGGKLTAEQQKVVDSSSAGISTLDRAIGLVKQQPQVFTQGRGTLTNLPWIGGPAMESLVAKGDTPQEQAARGAVFQEAATVAHELLGSAQSPSEKASVQAFLPSPYDDAQQIVTKLEGMKQISEMRRNAVLQGQQQKGAAPKAPAQQAFNSLPDPRQYAGRTIMNPDTGMRMKSNGTDWLRTQ